MMLMMICTGNLGWVDNWAHMHVTYADLLTPSTLSVLWSALSSPYDVKPGNLANDSGRSRLRRSARHATVSLPHLSCRPCAAMSRLPYWLCCLQQLPQPSGPTRQHAVTVAGRVRYSSSCCRSCFCQISFAWWLEFKRKRHRADNDNSCFRL